MSMYQMLHQKYNIKKPVVTAYCRCASSQAEGAIIIDWKFPQTVGYFEFASPKDNLKLYKQS